MFEVQFTKWNEIYKKLMTLNLEGRAMQTVIETIPQCLQELNGGYRLKGL
jgi:hypothetical protein